MLLGRTSPTTGHPAAGETDRYDNDDDGQTYHNSDANPYAH